MSTLRTRKPREYEAARRMRAEGAPFKRIAAVLGVSPSSVYAWTSDIPLTPEQLDNNRRGPEGPQNPDAQRRRAESWARRCRERRLAYQAEGRHRARVGDPLHLMGCMLYWAEGSKRKNTVVFTNSDVGMVRTFRRFLVESLAVDPGRIRVTLNVYTGNGLTIEQIEDHWLAALDLEPSCFCKHTLDHLPTSSSGNAKHRLPYGVCQLAVNETRVVQHIFGAIQEYAGFDEPAWVG